MLLAQEFGLLVHLVVQESGLYAGVTGETPSGGGELADETFFGQILGAEVIEVVLQLNFVFFRGFVFEDDGLGRESMSDGVEGEGVAALL
ncbi:MAG TPA: hypothetical protein VIX89_09020 [Bryobacteraceae bacterium]